MDETMRGTETSPDVVTVARREVRVSARVRTAVRARVLAALTGDAGMSTVEYAIGTLAAAAFGAVLYTVVSGDSIPQALGGIIQRALTSSV